MKLFKVMAIAFLAILGLNSCSNETTPPEFNGYDHGAAHVEDFAGTWTCLQADYAEALVISADGSAVSTGLENGEYWENIAGKVVVEGDKVHMKFEDNDNFSGHFDIIPGLALSLYTDEGKRYTYKYCENDLADEIVGMWVDTQTSGIDTPMIIQTYENNGKAYFTGFLMDMNEYVTNAETTYKVVGNLMIQKIPEGIGEGDFNYIIRQLQYVPNGNSLGDLLIVTATANVDGEAMTLITSMLRIKQNLDLADKAYNYSSAYISNAKGKDEDFSITGNTFNISKIKADDFNMMFHSVLFALEFNTDSIKQTFNVDTVFDTPITVDGNKVTLKMSTGNPSFRDVEMFMFQDKDNTQLHIYMPTKSFINYFANLELVTLLTESKIDPADTDAVAKVFADMDERIDSINVSFVLKARK